MKTILYIFITLIIISLPLVWISNFNHTNKTEITVIRDLTDKFNAMPNAEEIKSLYELENNIWDEGLFRLIDLTDLNINKTNQANINAENFLFGNKYKRKDKVKAFLAKIHKIISFTDTKAVGKDNSAVYYPIAMELNRLSKSKASTKLMLIYSDLMENTNTLTFYDKNTLKKLKTKPDYIQQNFESQLKLANLSGIKIYLIYQPTNTKQDEDYKVVSDFYRKLFESKGAIVEIRANLN